MRPLRYIKAGMNQPYKLGIIGCGDFLRIQVAGLKNSKLVQVKSLFDVDAKHAQNYADQVGGHVAASAEAILEDKTIDIVCPFVPPWLRKDLMVRAAGAGKHILATKPQAGSAADAQEIAAAVKNVRAGVIYKRTGEGWVETLRQVFASGEVGRLALFRHDWCHHYPQWNNWALDVDKNGGPFMDAEIHQLNLARHLMGRPMVRAIMYCEKLAHPDLSCPDTEMVKAEFAGNGSALMFITWANDLEVRSKEGNFRESVEVFYMVSDQGWRLTREGTPGAFQVVASRDGKKRAWPEFKYPASVYDRFAQAVRSGGAFPPDIATVEMARDDIVLVRSLLAQPGKPMEVNGI